MENGKKIILKMKSKRRYSDTENITENESKMEDTKVCFSSHESYEKVPITVVYSVQYALLPFLGKYKDIVNLYHTNKEIREIIQNYRWNLSERIDENLFPSVKAWRSMFPNAIQANLEWRFDVSDEDFVYLKGLETLNIGLCNQSYISDKAFKHLKSLRVLNMSDCDQNTITDKAFENLENLRELNINWCTQNTITENAFQYLKKLESLKMMWCNKLYEGMFQHLTNLRILHMDHCRFITDKAFVNFGNLHTLSMNGCFQREITDRSFMHLKNIQNLFMQGCFQDTITDKAFQQLQNIKNLNMQGCTQRTITEQAFCNMNSLVFLNLNHCDQYQIKGYFLEKNKKTLQKLCLRNTNEHLQTKAFQIFQNTKILNY